MGPFGTLGHRERLSGRRGQRPPTASGDMGDGAPATSRGLVGGRPRSDPVGIAVAAAAVKTGVVRVEALDARGEVITREERSLGLVAADARPRCSVSLGRVEGLASVRVTTDLEQ
jgi:hypothetical protein